MYLDNGDNVRCSGHEFAHIHIKVVESISLGLIQNKAAALTDSMDTPQVGRWIEGRIRWFGDG